MLIHDSWGGMYSPGQKQPPGDHGHPQHMHIETKQGGGLIGKSNINRSSGLQETMAYDKRSAKVMIQPMIIEKSVPSDPVQPRGGGGISMASGEVNSNADKFFAG